MSSNYLLLHAVDLADLLLSSGFLHNQREMVEDAEVLCIAVGSTATVTMQCCKYKYFLLWYNRPRPE